MNNPRPTIALKVASGKPSPEVLAQLEKRWCWRWQYLMRAPHRLSFLSPMLVLGLRWLGALGIACAADGGFVSIMLAMGTGVARVPRGDGGIGAGALVWVPAP